MIRAKVGPDGETRFEVLSGETTIDTGDGNVFVDGESGIAIGD